jgi:hypothetical protein
VTYFYEHGNDLYSFIKDRERIYRLAVRLLILQGLCYMLYTNIVA